MKGRQILKTDDVFEITYTKAPIRSIQQLLALMDDTRRKLTSVTCPKLAFRSEDDHVVPPEKHGLYTSSYSLWH
ncbi:hypothetical protein GCM10020331_099950 [Ectobacillus funiculus]